MRIAKIKSPDAKTEFAPTWNFPIGMDSWADHDKIDTIRNWLISQEQVFINRYPVHHDGGTGLGDASVTARHGKYNLFQFNKECPELDDMLNFIRIAYLKFMASQDGNWRELQLYSWFNIARAGESIGEHGHGADPESYLSGNMHLDTYNTTNTYKSPFDSTSNVVIGNNKGDITLFPSCVPHWSDAYQGDTPRVSIAFDLRPKVNNYVSITKSVPFMDQSIFNTITENLK